jgi:hypothetical protein
MEPCQRTPPGDTIRDQKRGLGMNISFGQYVKTGLLLAILVIGSVVQANGSESPLFTAARDGGEA